MDDLFSAYMNLENIDALKSPEADMETAASITRVVAIITIALQECFSRHFLCHACSGSELAYLRV
ncbi:BnaA03g54350D [Brassica napus]|uniref:BnaA03g54350D protein n=1 Tax=Brassica napus TaxID=3708 RepID=A0A078H297_BRANA|nr:BnaA03g54350D [Brassica napus]